jgi:hypothetical protein
MVFLNMFIFCVSAVTQTDMLFNRLQFKIYATTDIFSFDMARATSQRFVFTEDHMFAFVLQYLIFVDHLLYMSTIFGTF